MEQKRFVKAGLSTERLRTYVGMIEEEVDDYLNQDPAFAAFQSQTAGIRDGEWSGSFDVVKVMQEITILTASRTLQGKEVRANLNKEYARLYNDLDGGFTPINMVLPGLPLEFNRKRDRAQKKMSEFYVNIIRERKAGNYEVRLPLIATVSLAQLTHFLTQGDEDMITTLLNQTYRNGEKLKDHEIAHLMITLLMGGQHTSSASGSWALLHLAHNPDIW